MAVYAALVGVAFPAVLRKGQAQPANASKLPPKLSSNAPDAPVSLVQDNSLKTLSEVRSLAFSPNGSVFAAGCNGTIQVWNGRGEPAHVLAARRGLLLPPEQRSAPGSSSEEGVTPWVTEISFSPNGSLLAAIVAGAGLGVWSVDDGELLFSGTDDLALPQCIVWSPDGKWLVAGCTDGSIRLWNSETGKLERRLNTETTTASGGTPDTITALAFAGDETKLVSLSAGATGHTRMRWWDVKTGRAIHDSQAPAGDAPALSPRGSMLAAKITIPNRPSAFTLWDTTSGKPLRSIGATAPATSSVSGAGARAKAIYPSRLSFSQHEMFVLASGIIFNTNTPSDNSRWGVLIYRTADGALLGEVATERKPLPAAFASYARQSTVYRMVSTISSQGVVAIGQARTVELWKVPPPRAGQTQRNQLGDK